MITNEEVRKRFDNHKRKLEEYYGTFEDDDIDCIDEYISQQEKKDELLGLYQTLHENNNEHDYDLAPVLVEEMEKRIKQLKKELGEMK